MANTHNQNKYPPNFDKGIIYPAVYNLDEYPMPVGMEFDAGIYFNVIFDTENSVNSIPTLGYGKHKFDVTIVDYQGQTTYGGYELPPNLPNLKNKTRILFEFKDAAGTVIYSDTTPLYKQNGFSGYLWIKQDPLRTYNDIVEGTGTLTIVGKTDTNDPQWRNRYNVRVTLPIDIQLEASSTGTTITFYENTSPVIFQNTTSSMGSGSGLHIYETNHSFNNDALMRLSYINVSSSKMKTYAGEVKYISLYMKVSGSEDEEFHWLRDHQLDDEKYEDNIHSDYSQGINTDSEFFRVATPTNLIIRDQASDNKVKFKLLFKNTQNQTAGDYYQGTVGGVPTQDFELQYPASSSEWLPFDGSDMESGTSTRQQAVPGTVIARTATGNFSFRSNFITPPSGGGIHFTTDGGDSTFNAGGNGQQGPGSGDGAD